MESNAKCQNDLNALHLPTGFSNTNLKLEILDEDFSIDNFSSSKGYLQDFRNLDQLTLTASSFNSDIGIQSNGFDPFCHGSSIDFRLYEFKPYEESGSMSAAMQVFHDGGFFNFPDAGDSLMEIETALEYHDPKPLCLGLPDEISCVTADNLGCLKEHGSKRSKNSIRSNNSNKSESVSTKKSSWGRKKSKSAKGPWTTEEDRLLIHLVETYGVRKWSNIAKMLKGRIGKQCRERWHNHLRPDIKVGFEFFVTLNI